MRLLIGGLRALEILDSRGNPTLEVEAKLSDGTVAAAQVPSGASTGRHEAQNCATATPARYAGKGVREAVSQRRRGDTAAMCEAWRRTTRRSLDRRLIGLDGTPRRSGGSGPTRCSGLVARSRGQSANSAGRAAMASAWQATAFPDAPSLPVPMVNILSGGLHAGRNIEVPGLPGDRRTDSPHSARRCEPSSAMHAAARRMLEERRGCILTGVADEGGWGPMLEIERTGARGAVPGDRARRLPARRAGLDRPRCGLLATSTATAAITWPRKAAA